MKINNPAIFNYMQGTDGGTYHMKVVEIGGWDMDADSSKSVLHGLTYQHIRSVAVYIRPDDTSRYYFPIDYASDYDNIAGKVRIKTTTVYLTRRTGDIFDNVDYDDDTINRGWIVIWYEE